MNRDDKAEAAAVDTASDVVMLDVTAADVTTVDTATGEHAPSELSSERVHTIFSAIADRYDLFNKLSSFGIYRHWLRSVVRAADATPQTKMLDIAAGTGDVSFSVAEYTPPASITLTDFCSEMLDVAKQRQFEGSGGDVPITFETVDGQALPYPGGSYDLVTCAYGVRNMPDRKKAFSEAHRVLRTGGRYVILEFSTPPNVVWRALYHIYLKMVIPAIGGLLTGDKPSFVYLNDSIHAFPRQETLRSYLYEAGFTKVTYKNLTGGIVAVHIAVK